MRTPGRLLSALVLVVLLAAACGPSPAQQAATAAGLTAAAITDTPAPTATPRPSATPVPPTPTLTPTPIPYQLSLTVTDAAGQAVAGAQVALAELGEAEAGRQTTDEAGQAAWADLPGEAVTLSIWAQGYVAAEAAHTIERGPNELTVALERDPAGVLPAEACGPGETMLYVEDFQDGQAQGFPEIEFGAPGWRLGPPPDGAANVVASVQYAEGLADGPVWSRLTTHEFDNAAWRIAFMFVGQGDVSFNWRFALAPFDLEGVEVFDSRYQIVLNTTGDLGLRRLQQPLINLQVGGSRAKVALDQWHTLEVGTYQDVTEVWLDGAKLVAYQDPKPLPAGTFGLEYWPRNPETVIYFDNISVCQLEAAFTPRPTAEPTAAP